MNLLFSGVLQPSFYPALPSYLCENQERLQKRAMKIIYPDLSYAQPLELSGRLRGSLRKSGPLDFATKNTFPLFFVSEEALVGIY